jgi:hypothetical protein
MAMNGAGYRRNNGGLSAVYQPQPGRFHDLPGYSISQGKPCMTTPPNIRFAYMYRDSSNYKQHGEAVFTNEKQLPVDAIEKQIRACLHDGEFFIARQIHLEEHFFDALYDDDHPWHEFKRVEAIDHPTCDPQHDPVRDIAEFLADLEKAKRVGWDEMNVREDLARQFKEQMRAMKQRLTSNVKWLEQGDDHEDRI